MLGVLTHAVILALIRLRQEDGDSEVTLAHTVKLSQNSKILASWVAHFHNPSYAGGKDERIAV
jgi:hypothetical protein